MEDEHGRGFFGDGKIYFKLSGLGEGGGLKLWPFEWAGFEAGDVMSLWFGNRRKIRCFELGGPFG